MSEKLQFDQDAAQSAVEHRTASNQAIAEFGKAERQTMLAARLGKIAGLGMVGRFMARNETKAIKAELPVVTKYDVGTGEAMQVSGTNLDRTEAVKQIWRADDAAKADLEASFSQNYDNTVIEANNDFINRGSAMRIRTPNAMQEQADAAWANMVAVPRPQEISQPAEQAQGPVNLVK